METVKRCLHLRNSRKNLTANVFWDIDVFRVDFLPTGTRLTADTNHSFLSREYLREHAGKQQASNDSVVTLMVAQSVTLGSAGGGKGWRETSLECSHVSRPRVNGRMISECLLGKYV
jgi:hypothetical protein